jgi:DNA polymerase-3 subunit alpha
MTSYIHLRAHSQYSILDSPASVSKLAEKAASLQMKGLALTDHANLFGVVEFYKACKDVGIKPLIGCELYVAPESRLNKTKIPGSRAADHLTLLAKNRQGYQNLCKLSSIGYMEGFYYYPRIDNEVLKKYSEGLVCIDGALGTRLAHEILNGSPESTLAQLQSYKEIFGDDYYLDLQRHHMSVEDIRQDELAQESWLVAQYQDYVTRQDRLNLRLSALHLDHSIPLVATNDVHYIERDDWRAHEILLNIQSGEPSEIWEKDFNGNPKFRIPNPKRQTYPSHEYYFKSSNQMQSLFSDFPEAVANTFSIFEKCTLEIDFKTKHYPVYLPPGLVEKSYTKAEQAESVEKYLWELCEEGVSKRYTSERLDKIRELFPDKDPLQIVKDRLKYEMDIIVPKGMADYLLIVWDFINWAKRSGIPMGPGRGSGAGSIVLYLIGITDIEPLRFHLFFERFINPERISYPDIDVDICMDRRGEVIAYTLQKYGRDNIAQIVTFGTMKAKMALKDVGRVLSVPLAKVNEIAKLIPEDLNITLDKALERDRDLLELYNNDEEVTRLIDLARKLEGSIRNTGIHAAGIIISGVPLTELIPVCTAKDSEMPVTQFSMKPVEAVGMLKVDFLGLKTLTAIQLCVDAVKASTGKTLDWINLPLDDKPTFDLLNQGRTLGVFQLESGGMQDLARQLHLDKFEEIIAVGALYRPGPMDMIPSFINRKHGREPIEYDHVWMKDILSETYGIMVYQEQVMQIASKLANFSLGEGDVLRRAMGKKDMEQMAQQREKFRIGSLENEINEETSMLVFDKMEKFAAYGFNKSHAAAYGYLSYVTAFLKANYPKEWMAALLTCDRDDISKVAKFIRECQSMGISVLSPDINESGTVFQATSQGIRFAMTGIKGVGAGVVDTIVLERSRGGPFTSLHQFFKRVDAKKAGKKTVESLIEAGCFDFTGWSRDSLVQSVDPMSDSVAKEHKEQSLGILSLFSLMGETSETKFIHPPVVKSVTSTQEMLRKEKSLLGFFLTAHPMDEFKDVLHRLSCIPLSQIEEMPHDAVFRSAFIVESAQVRVASKSQKKFAILVVSDGLERYELPIWSDLYEEKTSLLQENRLLYAVLHVDKKEGPVRLSCKWLDDLTMADDGMVEACDRAYDKAKHQAFRFAQNKNVQPKSVPTTKVKETNQEGKQIVEKVKAQEAKPEHLIIKLNASETRLSHVLDMKRLLENERGSTPLQIQFQAEGATLAILHIDANRGVDLSGKIKEKLGAIKQILSVELGYSSL